MLDQEFSPHTSNTVICIHQLNLVICPQTDGLIVFVEVTGTEPPVPALYMPVLVLICRGEFASGSPNWKPVSHMLYFDVQPPHI